MSAYDPILPPFKRGVADAAKVARALHAGQFDKAGRPYWEHLFSVAVGAYQMAEQCPLLSQEERFEVAQIGWLHDVIEDVPEGAVKLWAEGFGRRVLWAVAQLSKPSQPMPYHVWIADLIEKAELPVLLVKLADIEDNSDPERLALLAPDVRERLLAKYEPAKEALRAAARAKGWQG